MNYIFDSPNTKSTSSTVISDPRSKPLKKLGGKTENRGQMTQSVLQRINNKGANRGDFFN